MRIEKIVRGEPFRFRVMPIPGTMTCKVKYIMRQEWVICSVTDDFKNIIFPEGKEEVFHFGGPTKKVKKLTIPKNLRTDFKEYANIKK